MARVSLAASRYCLEVSRISFFDLVGGSRFRDIHLTTVFCKIVHQISTCTESIYNFWEGGVSSLPGINSEVSATPVSRRRQ
jgi:hypothetical protein